MDTDDIATKPDGLITEIEQTQSLKYKQFKPVIDLIECGLSDSFETSTAGIRYIGNTCIDNNEARDEVAAIGFSWAGLCLERGDEDLKPLTVKAVYNICCDHEAAQKACLADGLHCNLIRYMFSRAKRQPVVGEWADGLWDLASDVLFDVCGHKAKQASATSLADDALEALLALPTVDADCVPAQGLDSFASLVETALAYLRDDAVQTQVIDRKLFGSVWRIFSTIEARLQDDSDDADNHDESESRNQLLLPLSASITWILSDLAARRGSSGEPWTLGPILTDLLSLLVDTDLTKLSTDDARRAGAERTASAACQVVGNALWAAGVFRSQLDFVNAVSTHLQAGRYQGVFTLHAAMIRILESAQSAELMHSAAGLLVNLTRVGATAQAFTGSHVSTAVERLCKHERAELRQDAVQLLRALGKDSVENRERYASQLEEVLRSLSQQRQDTGGDRILDRDVTVTR